MRKHGKNESGEVMLEGMIVMVVTMMMLVWLLGIFFLYYQKYTVRIATNDVTKKVAAHYDAPGSEVIMGYISVEELANRPLYFNDGLKEANDGRAESYLKYTLDKTNFNDVVQEVKVTVDPSMDAMGRSHIKVTTECTFKTPFGECLEWFGMSGERKYRVVSYADSTSLTDYVSTVTVAKAFTSGSIVKAPGVIGSAVNMVNSFMGLYGQLTEETEMDGPRGSDGGDMGGR